MIIISLFEFKIHIYDLISLYIDDHKYIGQYQNNILFWYYFINDSIWYYDIVIVLGL